MNMLSKERQKLREKLSKLPKNFIENKNLLTFKDFTARTSCSGFSKVHAEYGAEKNKISFEATSEFSIAIENLSFPIKITCIHGTIIANNHTLNAGDSISNSNISISGLSGTFNITYTL